MSVRPPNDLHTNQDIYDDIDILDLDDLDRRPAGASRQSRRTRPAPYAQGPSWADPRFLIPLLLFLTAVLLIGLAFRSNSTGDNNVALLDQEDQVIAQSDLAREVQEAELRAGFGGLTVTEVGDTIVIEGEVADPLVAASVGAVARSVEGTQRVDNRVIVAGGAIDVTVSSQPTVGGTALGDLATQLAAAGQITFDTGATSITAEGAVTVDTVARLLQQVPGLAIEIHGHTDSEGDETANQVLSQQRAEAVVIALGQRGVDTSRLTAIGFGESNPIAPNITADGRATNRRIEFVVQ